MNASKFSLFFVVDSEIINLSEFFSTCSIVFQNVTQRDTPNLADTQTCQTHAENRFALRLKLSGNEEISPNISTDYDSPSVTINENMAYLLVPLYQTETLQDFREFHANFRYRFWEITARDDTLPLPMIATYSDMLHCAHALNPHLRKTVQGRKIHHLFVMLIIQAAMCQTNSTFAPGSIYGRYLPHIVGSWHVEQDVNVLFLREWYTSSIGEAILTKSEGYNFITCFRQPALTFQPYLDPFQTELWIVIGLTLIVLGVGFTIYGALAKLPNFGWILLLISNMVEHSFEISNLIWNDTGFRIVFVIWSLMTVVITNGYKGLAITGVVAPIPGESSKYFRNLTSREYQCIPRVEQVHRKLIWYVLMPSLVNFIS